MTDTKAVINRVKQKTTLPVGEQPEEISWISFPNINSIKLAQQSEMNGMDGEISSKTYYWLDVYGNDGNYFQLWIKDCFGDTAWMCKTIISAYDYYYRSHVL